MARPTETTTITTAPHDIIKLNILERRSLVIDAFEWFYKTPGINEFRNRMMIRSRLIALFLLLKASLKRDLEKMNYDLLQRKTYSREFNDLVDAYDIIDVWCDKKQLTRIDTRKYYDVTSAENENQMRGL